MNLHHTIPTCSLAFLALALAFATGAGYAAPAPPIVEDQGLPITRVVLYKHGLGYFERQGFVTGESRIQLRFKQAEMSDVLKSLTVLDRGGGSIETIAYDSQKPPEMLLSEFAFDLRTDDPQQKLLEQLRGASVSVDFAGRGQVTGSVLGIDNRVERAGQNDVKHPRLSLLTSEGKVVSGDLDDMRSLRFDDEKLAAEIARYLAVLRTTHRRDQRALDLVCQGGGRRAIFAAYAVEQPVWKATWRLVLEPEKKPFLQGWAVVDNTSDEDWTNVRLSLVAGLPVSFRQDLYTPEFRQRPELNVEEVAAVEFFTGGTLEADRSDVDKGARFKDARKQLAELGYLGGEGEKARGLGDAFREVEAQSITREIGDLLEYAIDHDVTIPRNRSALLPIVASEVEGGKVALYNERARAQNPFSAVRMKNTTGLSLEGGPLTVLEGETYAGEAMLDSLKPNETRYVAYAVDLGVKATTKLESKSERVFKVVIVNGVLFASRFAMETRTYTFDNKNLEPRTVMVEHFRRQGFELRSPELPKDPADVALDRYRFELALGPQETKSLAVVEAQALSEQFSVSDVTTDQLTWYGEQKMLSADAERFLKEVVAAKSEIALLDRDAAAREKELAAIHSDEDRLRKNREALGDSADEKELVKVYVDQLRANEARVQELQKAIGELRAARGAKQTALEKRIREFVLEYALN